MEIKLSTFFLRFLICTVLSGVIVLISWLALLALATGFGIIIPANRVEQNVHSFIQNLNSDTTVTADMIPEGADYAIYDKAGILKETSLSDSLLEDADSLAISNKEVLNADFAGRVFEKKETDQQVIIFTYRIRAVFANPSLRNLLPSADICEAILFFLLLAADLILVITHYARKLSKELLVMQDIADQIGKQNLDFTIQRTRIRELNHVIDSLDNMRAALANSLKEQWHMQQQKKKQISALAHDIKTPLTIVRGNAELLQETELNAEQNSYNEFILQNTQQIQDYVTKMIEMSKETGEPALSSKDKTDVLFTDFLHALLENTRSLGQKKALTIRFLPETLPEFLPFPEESMNRILSNLLDNAVCYSPEHGTITLRAFVHAPTAASPGMLTLEVSDEGCGFSAEALKLGTEEFYRADNSRRSHSHFGMGLSITKQLVTALGGTLLLGNCPNGGAVVTVNLPLD